jgi:threonine dehydrogenase-like Zn-dependent dehydrogenase
MASDFDTALRILAAGPEKARALITHRFPLQEAAEAFRTASDKSSGSIKVQLAP